MSKRKKISLWIMGGVGVLLILLLAFLLIVPRLINLEPIREKALSSISEKVGGEVKFQRFDLSFFPLPHVVLHQLSLSIPGKVSGTLESLRVYPKLPPLIRGKLQIAELQGEAPDFKMELPKRPKKGSQRPKSAPSADIEETLAHLLAPLALKAPDLIVQIKNGRLDVLEDTQSVFSFHNIYTRIVFPPEGFTINLSCASNLWERIEVEGALDSEHLKGEGRIDLTHFQPHRLTSHLFADSTQRLADSSMDLSFSLNMDGLSNLQGDVQGSIPLLSFQQGNENLVVRGKSLKGAFCVDENQTEFSLTELSLDYPHLNMTANLLLGQDSPRVSLELEGRDVDVHSTREVALALAGDIANVQKIFRIVRGGKVPLITIKSEGNTYDDLKDMESFLIKGHILEGKILVPNVELDLEDAIGDAVISKGILKGENLEARLGNSRGLEGTLKLGLKGKDKPFHLDIMVEADLTQLPPIMESLVENKSFQKQISLIEDLKGRATGRLIFGESTKLVKVRLDVSQFNLSANYKRIPYPLVMSGGHFSYDETRVSVKNLSGKMGRSSFSELSAGVDLEKTPYLEIRNGKFVISLDEIAPWLTSFETLPIPDNIKTMDAKGVLVFSTLNLKGPLLKPENWHFEMSGEMRQLALNSSLLPGLIKVPEGSFNAIEDTTRQEVHLRDTQVSMLDASLKVTGVISDYRKGLNRADINLEGDMRSKSIGWVSNLVHIPPELNLRSPLSISEAHLVWEKDAKTSFKGNLVVQNGPRLSLDILQDPDGLMIKNLLVQDEDSRASAKVNIRKKALNFEFAGKLTKTTIHKIFVRELSYAGWVEGDFRAHILLDQPMRSAAQGKLIGEDLIFPWGLKAPLKIESVSLDAQGNNIQVETAICAWGNCRGALEGNVSFSETGLLLDMDLSSDGLDLNNIEKLLEKEAEGKDEKESATLWDVPVQGALRLKLGNFTYEQFTWSPFHADISFNPDRVDVAVTDANLCGISTPGVLKLTPKDLSLDFQLVAKNQELEPTLHCVRGEEIRATGNFDLKGRLKASGKGDQLVNSLQGDLEFVAKDGRIYRHIPLEKVFAYLSVTEIFRGQLPEMKKEGFAYKSITAKVKVQNGKFVLEEGIIDGLSMDMAAQGHVDLVDNKIDLTFLVAPMKTIDSIVKKIPVIREIMGGTLISVPVKVQGDLSDPNIKTLPASAVGAGLLGIMERTIKLPITVIEPVLPKDKEKQVAPQK